MFVSIRSETEAKNVRLYAKKVVYAALFASR
jgi:hypothetical protein